MYGDSSLDSHDGMCIYICKYSIYTYFLYFAILSLICIYLVYIPSILSYCISHQRLMPISIMKIQWDISFWINHITIMIQEIYVLYFFHSIESIELWKDVHIKEIGKEDMKCGSIILELYYLEYGLITGHPSFFES